MSRKWLEQTVSWLCLIKTRNARTKLCKIVLLGFSSRELRSPASVFLGPSKMLWRWFVPHIRCLYHSRGWAGKKPSICANTGYPAFVFGLPVIQAYRLQLSRKWARRIFSCAFLFRKWKWFPKINSENYKFSGFFPARYPVPALPEPEFEIREQDILFGRKYLVPVPLNL